MIETIIRNWILQNVQSIGVYLEIPDSPGTEYYVIERTGSSRTDWIDSATIVVQSYAKSMHRAAVLNRMLKGIMDDMVTLPEVSSCKLNSDYNYTDTDTHQYRYQAVFDVTYMI